MYLMSFFSADHLDENMDVFKFETESEAMEALISEMKSFYYRDDNSSKEYSLLDSALKYLEEDDDNTTYQCLDDWCSEIRPVIFHYKIKEAE